MSDTTRLYRYFDADGRLLYVGITALIRGDQRGREHERNAAWWNDAASATFTDYPTRAEALTAEAAAIRDENPIHNVARPPAPVSFQEVYDRLAPNGRGGVPINKKVTLTQAEAAQLLGVSPSTLRAWMRDPGFPLFTPPGMVRPMIPRPALEAWVDARTERAA